MLTAEWRAKDGATSSPADPGPSELSAKPQQPLAPFAAMTSSHRAPAAPRAGTGDSYVPVDPAVASRARYALVLASVALVLAGIGLVVGAAAFLGSGGGDACRTAAWDSEPAAADLPAGWTVSTSQVGIDGLGVGLSGTAADSTSANATIYATVSCFGADASAVISRSLANAEAGGLIVTDRTDLGDEGYAASDTTGSLAVHFRLDSLVTYAATSGTVTQEDLDTVAAAFDAAMGRALGGGGSAGSASSPASSVAPVPSASASSSGAPEPSASGAAAASPDTGAGESSSASPEAAPELVALLPTSVGGTTLTRDSATGADVLGGDAVSRALSAALRGMGASTDDLHAAQAYDETGAIDLYMIAFGVPGVPGSKLAPVILDTWLSATGAGVTTKTEAIGGKEVTTVDYGDQGSKAYVHTTANGVVVVQTADAALAAQAIAAIP
jgi:hypothetical protein